MVVVAATLAVGSYYGDERKVVTGDGWWEWIVLVLIMLVVWQLL